MEKQELFQIGDVAELFHISVGSLRHYEKMGLVKPEYIDGCTGYRYYSTRQFECLNTIRYLRVLGMPLSQIDGFLKNRNLEKIQEMLIQQREAVIRKQDELKNIERKIENRLQQLQDAVFLPKDTIQVKKVAPRRIAYLRKDFSINSYESPDFETSILKLGQGQKDTVIFLGKVGAGISKERLAAEQYDQYNIVFIILDEEDQFAGRFEELQEEMCVTIRFCGSHKDAPAYYRKLAEYIKLHDYRITGFSKEITMIDFGMTTDVSQFVTEIQIPVRPKK